MPGFNNRLKTFLFHKSFFSRVLRYQVLSVMFLKYMFWYNHVSIKLESRYLQANYQEQSLAKDEEIIKTDTENGRRGRRSVEAERSFLDIVSRSLDEEGLISNTIYTRHEDGTFETTTYSRHWNDGVLTCHEIEINIHSPLLV